MAQPIIGAKTASRRSKIAAKSQPTKQVKPPTGVSVARKAVAKPLETVAQVQHITVDEGSAGQRLDNFLIKVLKGAPKTLV